MLGQAPAPLASASPEVGEGEVLTGAELYHYLVEENANQLHQAETKMAEYTELKMTLGCITDRCRRSVLAPVANGLAYFEAELESTNNILVLLGDGWFAERSATQAAAIAQRRIDFLRREQQVLQEEKKNLVERRELFLSEMPEAQEAMQKVAAPATAARSAPAAAPTAAAAAEDALAGLCDPDLTTFDEQDELTEDELIDLERELADRIDDDAYVEQVMLERMIAKKEARVRAELARRQQQQQQQQQQSCLAQGKQQDSNEVAEQSVAVSAQPCGSTATSNELKYRTPADIVAMYAANAATGRTCALPEADTTITTTTTVAEVDSRQPGGPTNAKRDGVKGETAERPTKSVSFAEVTDVRYATPLPAPSTKGVTERTTYAVGDIVERDSGQEPPRGSAGGVQLPTQPPFISPGAGTGAKKRRSLFQREQGND